MRQVRIVTSTGSRTELAGRARRSASRASGDRSCDILVEVDLGRPPRPTLIGSRDAASRAAVVSGRLSSPMGPWPAATALIELISTKRRIPWRLAQSSQARVPPTFTAVKASMSAAVGRGTCCFTSRCTIA